jgi:integrase
MPKKIHGHPGIEPLANGKYRARVYFEGSAYQTIVDKEREGLEWQIDLKAALKRAPKSVTYVRGKWVATLDSAGTPVTETFKDVDSAAAWAATTQATITAGVYRIASKTNRTLGHVIEVWEKSKVRATDRTMERYRSSLRTHVLPRFGSTMVSGIEPQHIRDWVRDLQVAGSSPDAIGKAAKALKQVLNFATDEGFIVATPMKRVELPTVEVEEKRPLTVQEVEDLAVACGPYATLIRFMAVTGLRTGEMRALTVKDVHFRTREISVNKSATYSDGYKAVVGPTKTKAKRKVPFPEFLVEPLKELTKGQPSNAYLFRGVRGCMLNYGSFRRSVFMPALNKVGLGDEGIGMHNLRHTCASLLIQQNMSVVRVSKMLGHSTVTVTLNTYSHMYKTDLEEGVRVLNDLFVGATGLALAS